MSTALPALASTDITLLPTGIVNGEHHPSGVLEGPGAPASVEKKINPLWP